MQNFLIEKDRQLFGVPANSFPEGVQQAWQDLHRKLSNTKDRNFYGLSHGTKEGAIVYKACVEEAFAGEAENLGCERIVLPKGEYTGEIIHDYMRQLPKIGETFRALLALGGYDGAGACVEHYLDEKEVVCMIKKAGGK